MKSCQNLNLKFMTKRDFPPIHPGEILLEDFLKPMNISQYSVALAMVVPPSHINEIVQSFAQSSRSKDSQRAPRRKEN